MESAKDKANMPTEGTDSSPAKEGQVYYAHQSETKTGHILAAYEDEIPLPPPPPEEAFDGGYGYADEIPRAVPFKSKTDGGNEKPRRKAVPFGSG